MISKQNVQLSVIGHVDCGKSTFCGQLLYKMGVIGQKEIDSIKLQYEKEGRSRQYLSSVMSQLIAQNDKNNSEVMKVQFDSHKYNYTITDTSSLRDEQIQIIDQLIYSDVCILIIDATIGAFEAGFSKYGHTRQYLLLASTLKIRQVIVCVNKMDDTLVNYSELRFNEIKQEVNNYIRKAALNFDSLQYIPISSYEDVNLTQKSEIMQWYNGNTVIQALDSISTINRPIEKDLRITVLRINSLEGNNIQVEGRIESGVLQIYRNLSFVPFNRTIHAELQIQQMEINNIQVNSAFPGDIVKFQVKNLLENDIKKGSICGYTGQSAPKLCESFESYITVRNLTQNIKSGDTYIVNIHKQQISCELQQIIQTINRSNNTVTKNNPPFIKNDESALVKFKPKEPICVETQLDHPHLGSFIIADNSLLAFGSVQRVNYL